MQEVAGTIEETCERRANPTENNTLLFCIVVSMFLNPNTSQQPLYDRVVYASSSQGKYQDSKGQTRFQGTAGLSKSKSLGQIVRLGTLGNIA